MRFYKSRSIVALLAICLLFDAGASWAEPHQEQPARLEGLVQPFIITFDRADVQVIAFFADHPDYDAVEAFVIRRPGGTPMIRATLNQKDGTQVDHFNDVEVARERAAVLTHRVTVFRHIQYEEDEVNGLPAVRLRFTSHEGEDILLHFEAFTQPSPELGGFIDPGNHAVNASMPVLWAGASAFASPASRVLIDGVPFEIAPAPQPGALAIIYTNDFLIGVLRAGNLKLWQLWHPRRLAPGEKWLYWDQLGNLHAYEIIGIDGELLTLHKTSASAFLPEEVIMARLEKGRLRLRSVRATERTGLQLTAPPPVPQGFTLELSEEGAFSLSIDEHENLVTGTVSREVRGATTTWLLQPLEPSWTRNRTVRASVSRHEHRFFIENVIGEE
jgi:hypothetical protein